MPFIRRRCWSQLIPALMSSTASSSSDPLFHLVSGLYVALVTAPLVVASVARFGTADAGALYGALIVTLAAVTAVGWAVTARFDTAAVRLGGSALRWVPALFAITWALAGLSLLEDVSLFGGLAFFLGVVAMLGGLAVGVMARTRYTAVMVDGVVTEFRAGWPAAARRRLGSVLVAVVVVAMASFIVGVLSSQFLLQTTGQLLLPVGLVAYTSTQERRYTVSPAGLEQRTPVARQLFPWDAFDGYSRTDDALVFHRPWRVDPRFALAYLDDPDAVESEVERYL